MARLTCCSANTQDGNSIYGNTGLLDQMERDGVVILISTGWSPRRHGPDPQAQRQ
jgi:hypothetical protein